MIHLGRIYRHLPSGQMHRVLSIMRLGEACYEIVTVDLYYSFSWLGSNSRFLAEFSVPDIK